MVDHLGRPLPGGLPPRLPGRPPRDPRAKGRGTNQDGVEDAHPANPHVSLPPADPNWQPPDLGPRLAKLLHDDAKPRRTQTLFPYLLVRAARGDVGARPLWQPIPCWESCDIHLMPAAPGAFDFTRTVAQPVAGETYRVFVHVWNLGRLAAYGARLRAWWVEPGFFSGTPDPAYQPHYIGGTWLDLGDRDSGEAHRLIEIPTPWTVVMNNSAHECLLVAVECATDPWDGVLDANGHRHVAQRNLNLVGGAESADDLIDRLAGRIPERFRALAVSTAAVGRASLVGAHERGLAGKADGPGGDAMGGFVPGPARAPLLELRPGRGGLRYATRPERGAGLPVRGHDRLRLAAGTVSPKDLGELVAKGLGVRELSGAAVALRFGEPTVLRLVLTDAKGATGGYSIVFAP